MADKPAVAPAADPSTADPSAADPPAADPPTTCVETAPVVLSTCSTVNCFTPEHTAAAGVNLDMHGAEEEEPVLEKERII